MTSSARCLLARGALACLVLSCYRPRVVDCVLACDVRDCPDGMTCSAGLCTRGVTCALAVAAGARHSCAVVGSPASSPGGGQIQCWGNNAYGQLGHRQHRRPRGRRRALHLGRPGRRAHRGRGHLRDRGRDDQHPCHRRAAHLRARDRRGLGAGTSRLLGGQHLWSARSRRRSRARRSSRRCFRCRSPRRRSFDRRRQRGPVPHLRASR